MSAGLGWLVAALVGCTQPQFTRDDGGEELELDAGDSERPRDAAAEAAADRDAHRCEGEDCADAALDGLDAGGGDWVAASPEAGEPIGPMDAGLDPVRMQWVGRYATRSFVFSFDNPFRASGRYLTLAEITADADGGLTLTEELCRFESSFSLIAAHVLKDFHDGLRLTTPLTFDAEHFNSLAASAYLGYGPAPDGCVPGQIFRVTEARPWLADGTCDCPTSDAPPTSARDCRVIDSDGDSLPGDTFKLTLDTATNLFQATQEQRLRLVNGYRAGDRLYAQREYSDVTQVLSCTLGGRVTRVEDCGLGTVGPCPAMFNQVEMLLIGAHQGCAEIREREHGWFQKAQPEYPVGCPALVSP